MNTLVIIRNIYHAKIIMRMYEMGRVKQINIKN